VQLGLLELLVKLGRKDLVVILAQLVLRVPLVLLEPRVLQGLLDLLVQMESLLAAFQSQTGL